MRNILPTLLTMRLLFTIAAIACLCSCDQGSVNYKQLYVGFNGPQTPDTFIFTSADSANSSWLRPAMADHLGQVLSQVDFAHQVLIVAAVGTRPTATGKLEIWKVDAYEPFANPYVRIGVNGEGCAMPEGRAFPFVIAVIEKPETKLRARSGYDFQNFPDGCKPTLSNDPHDAN